MYTLKDVINGELDFHKELEVIEEDLSIETQTNILSSCFNAIVQLGDVYYVNHLWLDYNIFLLTLQYSTNFLEIVDTDSIDATLEELYEYLINAENDKIDTILSNAKAIDGSIRKTLDSYCNGANIQNLTKPESYKDIVEAIEEYLKDNDVLGLTETKEASEKLDNTIKEFGEIVEKLEELK